MAEPSGRGRAWVEIDLDALAYNVAELRSRLPAGCELMAVVKANAYGHGADKVAKRLWDEGVRAYAVATVSEGVYLRKHGLDGQILVMGYTHPGDAGFLNNFRLSQLVVSASYAKVLDEAGYEVNVHIAVDTGMHRQGIQSADLAEIESVYACKNLNVEGVATHLASSDSLVEEDLRFTEAQIERFRAVVDYLKAKGYNVGKIHSQASYGVYNYPDVQCDYARAGIAMYGVMSHGEITRIKPDLRPVLSLKALIGQVRWIGAGESVSYGRIYTTEKPIRLATVSIGYADGVPRHMSGSDGLCIIHGRKVPIVGRICMDMLMIDVTEVDAVEAGDTVTLIGNDGGAEIRCEDVAEASQTITNDILCRLGNRLPRVYKGLR